MTTSDATFAVQFWRHHFLNVDWLHQLEDAACSDLCGREIAVREYLPDSSLDKVRVIVRPINEDETHANGRTSAGRYFHAIEFQLFGYDMEKLQTSYTSMPEEYPLTFHEFSGYVITSEMERFCHVVLFLTSVCYAAAMHYELPVSRFKGDDFGASPFGILSIDRDPSGFDFLSAPITSPVNLDRVLAWSRKCSGIWFGVAKTRVEKAMSFFSHTMSSLSGRDEITRLIWSTAALEALVCDSNNSVSNQLKNRLPKISKFIGFKSLEKQIQQAYGFRSRLLHGDLPIYNAFGDNSDDKFESDKAWNYGHFLQILLISCLWTAISENVTGFEFHERLKLT
jgi:hypothetical protein